MQVRSARGNVQPFRVFQQYRLLRHTHSPPPPKLSQAGRPLGLRHHFIEQPQIHRAHGRKIAHADGADFAGCLIFFQRAPCAVAVAVRLMNQHHIDVIQIQTA